MRRGHRLPRLLSCAAHHPRRPGARTAAEVDADAGNDPVSSRLLPTEVVRVLRRDAGPLTDGTPLLDRIGMLDIARETHTVAESIERHNKTLDALHLATALLIGEPVTVASHDTVMKEVAEHLGFRVTDPVESS
ncbi:MAG: PIN domain-containing protein [Mycobacteriaceae bacterium]